jgi:mRNA interferase RelE/StbE
MYEIIYHPKVKNDLKNIDKKIAKTIKEKHIKAVQENPDRGMPLTGNLEGILSYHFKENKIDFRIAYTYNDDEKYIFVIIIAKRESFYEILLRRI